MLVRTGMAPRAVGLSYEQFSEQWRSGHADVAKLIPGLQSYLQNHVILTDGRPVLDYSGFDACSEIEFTDLAAMDAGFGSEIYAEEVRKDETTLIDKSRFMFTLADRLELAGDAPEDAVKLMVFWRLLPGTTTGELTELIARGHQTAADDGVLGHELLIERPGAHQGRPPAPWQIAQSTRFASTDDALQYLRSPRIDELSWNAAGRAQVVGRRLATVVVVVPRQPAS